jgi:hypothetical protein
MLTGIAHHALPAFLGQQDRAASAMALLLMLAGLLAAFLLALIVIRLTRTTTVGPRPRKKTPREEQVDAWSEAGRRLEVPPDEPPGDPGEPNATPPDRSA